MAYNKNPITLREGSVFLDGWEIINVTKLEIKFTPEVWTGRALGDMTPSTRWMGYTISGTLSFWRSTPLLKNKLKNYINSGITPEFKITGIMNDKNSDFYQKNGSDTVTLTGVVFTGDIILTMLDAGGDVVEDSLTFSAKGFV